MSQPKPYNNLTPIFIGGPAHGTTIALPKEVSYLVVEASGEYDSFERHTYGAQTLDSDGKEPLKVMVSADMSLHQALLTMLDAVSEEARLKRLVGNI